MTEPVTLGYQGNTSADVIPRGAVQNRTYMNESDLLTDKNLKNQTYNLVEGWKVVDGLAYQKIKSWERAASSPKVFYAGGAYSMNEALSYDADNFAVSIFSEVDLATTGSSALTLVSENTNQNNTDFKYSLDRLNDGRLMFRIMVGSNNGQSYILNGNWDVGEVHCRDL